MVVVEGEQKAIRVLRSGHFDRGPWNELVFLTGDLQVCQAVASTSRKDELYGTYIQITWRFPQMEDPKVTIGFNILKSWSFMTWMIWGNPILGNP